MALDLFPDRFHRRMRAQETIGQGLVFAQQSEQQVFSLNIRRAELAGLVPRKEDNAPGFLCIAFEHIPPEFLRTAPPSAKPMTLPHYAFLSPDDPSDIRLVVPVQPYFRVLRTLTFRSEPRLSIVSFLCLSLRR